MTSAIHRFLTFALCPVPLALSAALLPQGGAGGAVGGGGSGGSAVVSNPTPLPPLPSGTGAISGTVVDGTGDRPLADVVVTLRMEPRGPAGPLALRPVGQKLTDAKGRFVFTELPPSDAYTISARRGGYFTGAYGANHGETTGARIVLADGQWFNKADLRMWPTGAVSGRVLDEYGDPVVGAYVRVLRHLLIGGRMHLGAGVPVTTDDRGVYRIAGLDPGKYLVCVPSVQASVPFSAGLTNEQAIDLDAANRLVVGRYPVPPSGETQRIYPTACHPESTPIMQATPVTVVFGADNAGIDIRLRATQATRVTGRVEGVIDAAPGLTLRLISAGSEDLGQGSETATALVAGDGTFTFLGVPPGSYVIEARDDSAEFMYATESGTPRYSTLPAPPRPAATGWGWSSKDIPSGPPRSALRTYTVGARAPVWGRATVVVDGREVGGVVLSLHPTITLTGQVIFDGAADRPSRPPLMVAESTDGRPSWISGRHVTARDGGREFHDRGSGSR
jgi:hypothetical protein